jgi:nitrite reductase/ring-hydroxylating ferredoxin subunit
MEDSVRDDHLGAAGLAGQPLTCQACVSRRRFLGQSALAAATAAFLAACGDGQIGGGGVTGPVEPISVTVADFPGLATVGKLVNVNAQVAAKRTGTASFAAFSRSCTHEGTQLDLFQTGFFCSNHLSQFDNDGHVTAGPATRDLDKLTTAYDAATDKLTIG